MVGRRGFGLLVASGLACPAVRAAPAARRLRLALNTGLETGVGAASRVLAERVKSGTEGRVRIDTYPNATLGHQAAVIKSVAAGALDLAMGSSSVLSPYVPEVGLLDMPFLFDSSVRARAVLDGPEGALLAEAARPSGLVVLSWGENGVRHLTGNRPFRTAADVKHLKLRVLPSPLLVAAFRCMGADAESLPFTQVYEALLTGRFEAEENPLQLILDSRFYEVQSHVTLTAHTYTAAPIIASADVMEDLDAHDRGVLVAAAAEAAAVSRAYAAQSDMAAIAVLKAKGMTVVADPDWQNLRDAAAPAEAEVAARFGADRIARLRA